ncbi:Srb5p Ecym_4423 [Eremothecium cymbalariae DBVPG|uniref:Mediator of RNA polymerase II transcription subunit 18 n=1 Tax=Eremothecium cymbalariae (strain CBS 270.75 / DBVPG 7215 / KCTC 17166 / NRRL Y-17582) TaxID=931890 RepID=G8JTW9_ERECY|nr:hypothetical protein Ecym_4423 [Eremothecium cymbalariae DBVPG\
MVQRLSLFSAIDDDSFELLISTISTLSGRPPVIFANFSHVAIPDPTYDIEKVNVKNQLVEQTRIRIMQDIPFEKIKANEYSYRICSTLTKDDLPIERDYLKLLITNSSMDSRPSSLSIWDIPSAGKDRKVCMQSMTESVISDTGGSESSINAFLKELGYVPDYQFVQIGTKFYMESGLVFQVYKIWNVNDSEESTNLITKGGFLIEAYVNVAKITDIEAVNQGTKQLLNLKRELREYIDLVVPDRKCMDPRIGHLNDF